LYAAACRSGTKDSAASSLRPAAEPSDICPAEQSVPGRKNTLFIQKYALLSPFVPALSFVVQIYIFGRNCTGLFILLYHRFSQSEEMFFEVLFKKLTCKEVNHEKSRFSFSCRMPSFMLNDAASLAVVIDAETDPAKSVSGHSRQYVRHFFFPERPFARSRGRICR
jgi:hypothetical protein